MDPLPRIAAALAAGTGAVLLGAGPAAACGGLVGENGSIELVRTTTLAAWHDGIEHYVTSFEFAGDGESVGSIIPLPAEPIDVVRGGDWTLQRLQLEVSPPRAAADEAAFGQAASRSVEILLETEIDALDITVLAGGGDAVGAWALDNGFLLTPDAPEVLDFYARRSPVFLAARFDAGRAAEQGLANGQATPVHVTMATPRPWVPLRILGLGLEPRQEVEADVFLLTDDQPSLLAGGRGLDVARSAPASTALLDDLRSDRGMEWVPGEMWLTHLTLDEDAGDLDYDLSASGAAAAAPPSAADAGLVLDGLDGLDAAVRLDPADEPDGTGRPALPIAAVALGAAALAVAGVLHGRGS
jgi:hypothetical protein